MQMNPHPLDQVLSRLYAAGMERVVVTLSDHGGVLTAGLTTSMSKGEY